MYRSAGDSKREGEAATALSPPPPSGLTNYVAPTLMPAPLDGTAYSMSRFPFRLHISGSSPSSRPSFPSDHIETLDSNVVKGDLHANEQYNEPKVAFLVENKRRKGLCEPAERNLSEPDSHFQASEVSRQMRKIPEKRTATQRVNPPQMDHIEAMNGNISSQAPIGKEICNNPVKREKETRSRFGDVGGADSVRDLCRSSNDNRGEKTSINSRKHSIDESMMDKNLTVGSTVEGGQSLIVDEFGRLAQKGVSESDSEGYRRSFKRSRSHSSGRSSSSSIRRRSRDKGRQQGRGRRRHWSRSRNRKTSTSRGRDWERGKNWSRSRSDSRNSRSRSRSRSHEPRPRRQSISRSPRRRKTSSRSFSPSPQRQRNFSRSPPKDVRRRGMGKFERNWKVDHDPYGRGRKGEKRGRPSPCIHFARGRCSRGNACRFLHVNIQAQGHDASNEDIYFEKHGLRKDAVREEYIEGRHDRGDWGRDPQVERFDSKNSEVRQGEYIAGKQLDSLNARSVWHKREDGKGSSNSATVGMAVSIKESMARTLQGKPEEFALKGVEPVKQGIMKEKAIKKHEHVTMVEQKTPTNIMQNVNRRRESPKLSGDVNLHEISNVLHADRTEETENEKNIKIPQMRSRTLETETTGNTDSRVNAVEKNILETDFETNDIYVKALDLRGKLQEHIIKMSLPSSIENRAMNGTELATKIGVQMDIQGKLNTKNNREDIHVKRNIDQPHVRNELQQSLAPGHQLHIPSMESGFSVQPPQNSQVQISSNPLHSQYYSSNLSQHPVQVGGFPHQTSSNNTYKLHVHNASSNTQPLGQSPICGQSHENSHAHASTQVPGHSPFPCQQPSSTLGTTFYGQSFPGTQYSQMVNSEAAQYLKPSNVLNVVSILHADSEAPSPQNSKTGGVPNFGPNMQPSLLSPPVMHNSAPMGQPGHSSIAQTIGLNLPFQQIQLAPGAQGFNSSVSLPSQQTAVTHPIVGAKTLNITNTVELQPSATTQNNGSWLFHSQFNQAVSQLLPTGLSTPYSYALTKVPPLSDLVKAPESNNLPDQYDPLSDVLDTELNATAKVDFTESLEGIKPSVSTADTQASGSENISAASKSSQQGKVNASEAYAANDTTAHVGTVDNHSPENWSPGLPGQRMEVQSDQRLQPLSKKGSRGLKMLRAAVAEHVKEVLKPTWREGYMSKEAFKTIAKKAVDKVIGNLPNHHIPKTPEKVDQFMKSSRPKISKLVQGYVDKYLKL